MDVRSIVVLVKYDALPLLARHHVPGAHVQLLGNGATWVGQPLVGEAPVFDIVVRGWPRDFPVFIGIRVLRLGKISGGAVAGHAVEHARK